MVMARTVHSRSDARNLRVSLLTQDLVIDFRRIRRRAMGKPAEGDLRHNYSLNSTLRQAQSVFSRAARKNIYQNLRLPMM